MTAFQFRPTWARAFAFSRLFALATVTAVTLTACPGPQPPQPGPFQAGISSRRMPAPVGIGTPGNAPKGSSPSPYAVLYPGTRRIHGHPSIKAVALSRGPEFEVIVVRLDQIAIIEQLRDAVVAELQRRTGRSFDKSLLLAATHTHSGPGRFIDGEVFSVIGDIFLPEYYLRLVGAIADTVQEALADLAPAEVGHTFATAPHGHANRRCEDLSDHKDSTIPVITVRRGGRVEAIVAAYAIHGTVVGIDQFTLSQDVHGAIEEFVENLFPHEVTALMLSSWAGDMSPGSRELLTPEVPLSSMPGGYVRMETIASYVAPIIADAANAAVTTAEPVLEARLHRYPIDREKLGYGEGEFPFEAGAVYCGVAEASCEELKHLEGLDRNCLAFPENAPAPKQSNVGVGRIGGLHFVTWPGESSTTLAEKTLQGVRGVGEVQDVAFFGYSNGYLGYQLVEEDWWHGGYEASGGMWGPRQGDYMSARVVDVFGLYSKAKALPFAEPAVETPFDTSEFDPVQPDEALEVGRVVAQPQSAYPSTGVASVTVNGTDPWNMAPRAVLQRVTEDGAEDVLRPGGRPFDSDGYAFWVDLDPEPAWSFRKAGKREFRWTFSLALARLQKGFVGDAAGTFRFRIVLPTGGGESIEVVSDPFVVDPG